MTLYTIALLDMDGNLYSYAYKTREEVYDRLCEVFNPDNEEDVWDYEWRIGDGDHPSLPLKDLLKSYLTSDEYFRLTVTDDCDVWWFTVSDHNLLD